MAAVPSTSSSNSIAITETKTEKVEEKNWFTLVVELFQCFVPPDRKMPSEEEWYAKVNAIHLAMPSREKREDLDTFAVQALYLEIFPYKDWAARALETMVKAAIFPKIEASASSLPDDEALKTDKVVRRVLAPKLKAHNAEALLRYSHAKEWLVQGLIAEMGEQNMKRFMDEMDLVRSLGDEKGRGAWELRQQVLRPLFEDLPLDELKKVHAVFEGMDIALEGETGQVYASACEWVKFVSETSTTMNCPNPVDQVQLKVAAEDTLRKAMASHIEIFLKQKAPSTSIEPPSPQREASDSDTDSSSSSSSDNEIGPDCNIM